MIDRIFWACALWASSFFVDTPRVLDYLNDPDSYHDGRPDD